MQVAIHQRRHFYAVLVILCIAILLDQSWIAKWAPWFSNLIGFNFIPVILGIPVNMELTLGLLPILGLFAIMYGLFLKSTRKNSNSSISTREVKKIFWNVLLGLLAIPFCVLLFGTVYFLVRDHLSRNLCNGIESIGLNADIYLFGRSDDAIHLKGGILLLGGFLTGVYIFRKQVNSIHARRQEHLPIQEKVLEPV
jgi:uncharacterized membrane protein YjgN (DUF898 family)